MSLREDSPSRVATVAPTHAVGLHGAAVAFDPSNDDWSEYIERLQHYFTANDILAADKQHAILLNAVGAPTCRLIRTLVSPAKVTKLSFAELVEKAQGHFNPRPSFIVKRFEFNSRCQGPHESIATYVAELRKIAEYCDYKDVLSDMLRDRLVCGTSNKTIQRRFLQETALTFDKALEIALSAEAADKDVKRLTTAAVDNHLPAEPIARMHDSPPEPPGQVNNKQVRSKRPQQSQRLGKGQGHSHSPKQECFRCVGKHSASTSRFKQYECHFCKKRGHLFQVCRKRERGSASPEEAHHVGSDSTSVDEEYNLFHIWSGQVGPYCVSVSLNGNPISMEIDTGASVSIISLEKFKSIRHGESILELEQTPVKLQTYNGGRINVCGSTEVEVSHMGQTLTLPLVVTEGSGPALLGGRLDGSL